MAIHKLRTTTFGQFLPTGTTPKAQSTGPNLTASDPGSTFLTSLRLRTDVELYVRAVGTGSANIDLSFMHETIMVVASEFFVAGHITNSDTPLTTPDPGPTTFSLGDYVQYEYLYPTIDFVNVITPQVALVTWRPKGGTIDTQARRRVNGVNGIDVFMPWEIQDGSGLINTTTAGVTYSLGARFTQRLLYESDGS